LVRPVAGAPGGRAVSDDVGGHVRKGEHGIGIVFVKDLLFKDADAEGNEDDRHVRMLKRYVVFNIAQCDDLPDKLVTPPVPKWRNRDAPDLLIEEFLATTGANIRERPDRAVYNGKDDFIALPARGAFKSIAEYYNTVFTSSCTGPGSGEMRWLMKPQERRRLLQMIRKPAEEPRRCSPCSPMTDMTHTMSRLESGGSHTSLVGCSPVRDHLVAGARRRITPKRLYDTS
jgi:hypothetical protein